jgi:hypothetical protein
MMNIYSFSCKFFLFLIFQFLLNCSFAQTTFITTFGGPFHQIGNSIKECKDGGYIIAGAYIVDNNNVNLYIAKMNKNGVVLWTRIYGGAGMDSTEAGPGMGGFDVIQSADEHYVVSGWKYYQDPKMLLIKVNDQGSTLWTKEMCGYWGQSIQQSHDGGYICLGDGLTKTDNEGEVNWCLNLHIQGMYVLQTSDSNYVLSGSSYGDYYVYLEKYNSSGTPLWTKTFPGEYYNSSNNILAESKDSGFVLTVPFNHRSILFKTNDEGDVQWTDTFDILSTSIVQTRDGGYAIGGFYGDSCGLTLIKTDSMGKEIWRQSYCAPKPKYHYANSQIKSMHQTSDGGFIMTGFCGTPAGDLEVIVLKTDSLGFIHTTTTNEVEEQKAANVFPNPWSSNTTLQFQNQLQDAELSLFNVLGEIIFTKSNLNGDQVELERGTIPTGIYFALIKDKDNSIQVTNMIIVDP